MTEPAQNSTSRLRVFVINLDSRPDRWRLQTIQSRVHRLQSQRFPAKDGSAGKKRFPNSPLTDGATGIWHSFDSLVNLLSLDGIEAAVILEDDAIVAPGFLRKAERIRRSASSDVALVQLGFLTESSWRPQNSLVQNLRKILRPRSRARALMARFKAPSHQNPPSGLRAGMHAVLVFPDKLIPYLQALYPTTPVSLPLDNALVALSRQHPTSFVRARRSMAFQLPVKSDITWRSRA